MDNDSLITQVKEGKPQAIADFIRKNLDLADIQVQVILTDNCLRIVLEAERIPNKTALANSIYYLIKDIQIDNIDTLKVYGRPPGQIKSDWREVFFLDNIEADEALQSAVLTAAKSKEDEQQDLELLAEAYQAKLKALEMLISNQLNLPQVKVEGEVNTNYLEINLQAKEIIEQSYAEGIVVNGIRTVELDEIETVEIEAYQEGKEIPVWTEQIARSYFDHYPPEQSILEYNNTNSEPNLELEAQIIKDLQLMGNHHSNPHFILSILVMILLNLPLGFLATAFAIASWKSYRDSQFSLAEGFSKAAKWTSIIGGALGVLFYGYLLLFIKPTLEEKRAKISQDTSQIIISLVNDYQKNYYLHNNSFDDNPQLLENLGIDQFNTLSFQNISLGEKQQIKEATQIKSNQSEDYHYKLQKYLLRYTIIQATAKKRYLRSYTGVTFAQGNSFQTLVCETDKPVKKAPQIDFNQTNLTCPFGSSSVPSVHNWE